MDSTFRTYEAERNDPRPPGELIPLALLERESDDPMELYPALFVMQLRASDADYRAAKDLCKSDNPKERALGATILGQNLVHDKSFPEEKIDVLLSMLESDSDPEVLQAACMSLGHIGNQRAVGSIARLRSHPSEDVRYGVVHGLNGQEDELALNALIELSADSDQDVRNWATFELGTILDLDTDALRNALVARLEDDNDEVRGEALVGLAKRGDARVVPALLRELSGSDEVVGRLAFDAVVTAGNILGDPLLHDALVKLRSFAEPGNEQERLEQAIKNSQG